MRRLTMALLLALLPVERAAAHEFSLGVHASGADARATVVAAVRGALLAADERDGHPDETSDGHLGGLDVHIVPIAGISRITLQELMNAHGGALDLLLVLDDDMLTSATVPGVTEWTVVLGPGDLPDLAEWSGNPAADGFAGRFRAAWATEPDVHAAQGYNAARRIDIAIRPHDGVEPIEAIREALTSSSRGLAWR